jgi:hypothetical protein
MAKHNYANTCDSTSLWCLAKYEDEWNRYEIANSINLHLYHHH